MKTVAEQMELARKAQEAVAEYTQEQIDEVRLAIGWEVYRDENIAKLARMAVEETGYGNVESKILKHKRKVGGVMHDIRGAVSVGLMERDEASGISKYAKPVGVVCAILPPPIPRPPAAARLWASSRAATPLFSRPVPARSNVRRKPSG